ncbi:MAG: DUF1569 domain-containing protein [Pseudomonadales bacterium]|nr:DUF1569 domain-containing protein [Pseudomonadales bacterium]
MNKAIDIKPSSISRKTFLRLSVGTLAAVSLGPLAGCAGGRKLRFETIEDALKELALIEANEATLVMDQPWSIYKVMIHLSQSMEYSMTGYPELDPPAKQAAAKLVWQAFKTQGYMSHNLGAVVPGAPEIPDDGPTFESYERYRNACSDFQNYTSALHPHFSYGELTYEEWELAHAFHAADHFSGLSY